MTAAWKLLRFFWLVRSDFHITDNLSIAVHAFACHVLMFISVDETLLPRLENLSTSFRELTFSLVMSPLWLKRMYSVLSTLKWRPMPATAGSRNVARCWLVQVYLPEELCYRRHPRPLLFMWGIFCFFPLSSWNRCLSFYQ